jgi:hypothetical protein
MNRPGSMQPWRSWCGHSSRKTHSGPRSPAFKKTAKVWELAERLSGGYRTLRNRKDHQVSYWLCGLPRRIRDSRPTQSANEWRRDQTGSSAMVRYGARNSPSRDAWFVYGNARWDADIRINVCATRGICCASG